MPTLSEIGGLGRTACLHWSTDWFTSRLSGRYYRADREKAFWNVIGTDQWVHALTLGITTTLVLS